METDLNKGIVKLSFDEYEALKKKLGIAKILLEKSSYALCEYAGSPGPGKHAPKEVNDNQEFLQSLGG